MWFAGCRTGTKWKNQGIDLDFSQKIRIGK